MLNKLPLIGLLFLSLTATFAQIQYPETKKIPVTNTYHGIDVLDEYQWLEDSSNPAVQQWIEAQNKTSLKYLKKISATYSTVRFLEYLGDYDLNWENYKTEVEEDDDVRFRLRYTGLNSPPSIFYSKGSDRSYEKLTGPNAVSKTDRINFEALYPSGDARFLAYAYNRNGSDWAEVKVLAVKNRHYFDETLVNIIAPQITWYGQGFFYVRRNKSISDAPKGLQELMYHKLGTDQSEDVKILGANNKNERIEIYGLKDQSMFFLKKSNAATKKNSYFYLKPNENVKGFKVMFFNIDYNMDFIKYKSDTIFASTSIKNNKHVLKFPLTNTKQWTLLNPSYEGAVLTDYEFANDKLVASYLTGYRSFLTISDLNGKVLGEVNIPKGLSIRRLSFSKKTNEFFFRVSSYTVPPVPCQLNLLDYTFRYLGKTEVRFDASKYKFSQRKFTSHDGKEVPMFIVYKDSIKSDGTTPFLLETYGGYGAISQPSFDPNIIYFLEKGGAYAYVNIRGGGNYGPDWALEGRNLNKKNGIYDFNDAAKYLIDEGLTKPKKIGIMGGSHGGLITAAAMLNKPEYYGAAVISAGALDMLRIELTPNGMERINLNEFGTIQKEDEFLNILSYSPFHNIKNDINYPSTLIITGSHDTRVEPWQSFKFAGRLQNGVNQTNPILMWTQEDAGHSGASGYYGKKEEEAFIYKFLLNELNKEDKKEKGNNI